MGNLTKKIERYKPKKPGTLGRKKPEGKTQAYTAEDLIQAIKDEKPIDSRIKAAKSIKRVLEAVRKDLDSTAVVLLEQDIANCAVIEQLCLKEAFKDPDKAVDSEGNLHPALTSLLKFQTSARTSMLALKKFKRKKPSAKGLGDLFLEQED
jgi:hypothetical protein